MKQKPDQKTGHSTSASESGEVSNHSRECD